MRSIVHGMALVGMVMAAAPPAEAQAPRGTAEQQIGPAKLSIEYGAPPWNESRSAQLDQSLPIGKEWRLGADRRTTLLVDGGDVMIGGVLVEAGGYGLNLRRLGDKEYAFVAYDGSDTDVAPDDTQWEIPAKLVDRGTKEPSAKLVVTFAEVDARQALVVRFGPLELSAPMAALATRESELAIAGESASSRWFSAKAADVPAGRFMRAGRVGSFYVGESDGAFDVDLKSDGANATVRFTSRDRAKVSDRLARKEAAGAAMKKRSGAAPSPRVRQAIEQLDAELNELRAELAGMALLPSPFEMTVPLVAAKKASGTVGAEVVSRNDRLFVVVDADGKSGEVALDLAALIPKSGAVPR